MDEIIQYARGPWIQEEEENEINKINDELLSVFDIKEFNKFNQGKNKSRNEFENIFDMNYSKNFKEPLNLNNNLIEEYSPFEIEKKIEEQNMLRKKIKNPNNIADLILLDEF